MAYRDKLSDLTGDDVLDESVIRTIDGALDRARLLLGDDRIPSLVPPEAVMDGDLWVRAGQAAVVVAGVIARLQDPPQREVELGEGPPWGWSYTQRPEGFKRTW